MTMEDEEEPRRVVRRTHRPSITDFAYLNDDLKVVYKSDHEDEPLEDHAVMAKYEYEDCDPEHEHPEMPDSSNHGHHHKHMDGTYPHTTVGSTDENDSLSETFEQVTSESLIDGDDLDTSGCSDKHPCDHPDNENRESLRQLQIARKEQWHVRIIRTITLSFICCCTLSVCVLVFRFAKDYDEEEFLGSYEAHVENIQNDIVWEIRYNIALMQQLAATITSEMIATNQSAPFVTLPRFEVLGGFADGLGGLMMASFVPLVKHAQKKAWEAYSVEHQSWLEESVRIKTFYENHKRPLEGTHQDHETDMIDYLPPSLHTFGAGASMAKIPDQVWKRDGADRIPVATNSTREDQLLAPLWQTSPADSTCINMDLLSDDGFAHLFDSMVETNYQTLVSAGEGIDDLFDWMYPADDQKVHMREPHAYIVEPIFSELVSRQVAKMWGESPVGLAVGLTSYKHLFENILPDDASVFVILKGSAGCGKDITFELDGPRANFIGYGAMNDVDVDNERMITLDVYDEVTDGICVHDLYIYPTTKFRKSYDTNKAAIFTGVIAAAFLLTTFCFLIYERLVTKREKTKNAALKVVASLFPTGFQDRVLKGVEEGHHHSGSSDRGNVVASFYPATTVMFADIAGFTAWSSTRDPEQVFRLLETVYGAMDEIATRRGVFKVETVGDCYVAVCGLPEARSDHAVAMTRFARDCQMRMASLGQQLEIALGPDTADLSFRIGMHSGPVTGGVLRGQNARFQLFGDTMNQASRMESTGVRDRIQMSTTTAQLLIEAGKSKWVEKRPEKVDVKGKGLQETYFFREPGGSTAPSTSASRSSFALSATAMENRPSMDLSMAAAESMDPKLCDKSKRLVTWNTEVLLRRLKAIVQQRSDNAFGTQNNIDLDPNVVQQLQRHVEHIASMYRNNPFHNYEHASHVTLSMEKMLSQVKEEHGDRNVCNSDASGDFSVERYTSCLTSDPLAQFAVVYSALIHDVDHTGASNAQLIKENDWVALEYKGRSPAENHAINLSWTTLMMPDYRDLVECLCPTTKDLERLRQLITDAVLATDIFDKDLIQNRNTRWEQVFGARDSNHPENIDTLRVMIVLDHLIQASDVAHTMQHWHVYIKWNERFFHEQSIAYECGRLEKDPAETWYSGELWFYDNYVIPLAKKLKECGVFGVSCYEFLNYAETNRSEWAAKGESIVAEYVRRYQGAAMPRRRSIPLSVNPRDDTRCSLPRRDSMPLASSVDSPRIMQRRGSGAHAA